MSSDFEERERGLLGLGEGRGLLLGEGAASAAQSTAVGVGLWHARVGTPAQYVILAKDGSGKRRTTGGDDFVASVSGGARVEVMILDHGDGSYSVAYTCEAAGRYRVSVRMGGDHVRGSPF
ncbi:immunoglobulin E-set, partial [Pavlovales sp. CCMP2436]